MYNFRGENIENSAISGGDEMAAWYYTRDGGIFGPYSEEAMAELIDNGSVTFVTMVWDSEKNGEGREWVYAYDTPLVSYFSAEFSLDELPGEPEADVPPIPPEQVIPESSTQPEPAQTKPLKSELSPQETSPRLIILFFVLFIIGLIIGTTSWYITH